MADDFTAPTPEHAGDTPPNCHHALPASVSNEPNALIRGDVSPGFLPVERGTPLTDELREENICRAGIAMQRAYGDFLVTNKQADLDRAYRHMEQMRELVQGRRPEFVAQLEQQRGLK